MRRTRSRWLATSVAIVVAFAWVVAFAGVPSLFHRTHGHNETSAIATLRNLCAAQHEFKERALADADADGKGEYGLFGELSGGCFVRGTKKQLDPPLLSGVFRAVDEQGVVRRSGYCFRVFLPGREGAWVTEAAPAQPSVPAQRPGERQQVGEHCPGCGSRQDAQAPVAVTGPIAADGAEERWYAYAWPLCPGNSGNRSFYVDQDGDVYTTAERRDGPPSLPLAQDGRHWTPMR